MGSDIPICFFHSQKIYQIQTDISMKNNINLSIIILKIMLVKQHDINCISVINFFIRTNKETGMDPSVRFFL